MPTSQQRARAKQFGHHAAAGGKDPREQVLRGLITKELGRVSAGLGEFLTLSVAHLPPLGRAAGEANLELMRASLRALRALPTAPIRGHYKYEQGATKRLHRKRVPSRRASK